MERGDDLWVREAIEQARIILAHLENGGRNDEFLRPHALALLQSVDLGPVPIEVGAEFSGCYLI